MQLKQRGNVILWIIIIIVILLILGVGGYYALKSSSANQTATAAKQSEDNGIPQAKIDDMAPNIPRSQKTEIMTMQPDSTYEEFLVPNTNVDTFIKTLPKDVTVVSKKPLQ